MRLPSSRSGSTASSVVAANSAHHRLSVDSAALLGGGILVRGRAGSTMSTASSLRPMSTKSRDASDSSGAASVRWDEVGLQTVKEIRQKKETRRKEKEKEREKEESKEKKKSKKSKSKSSKDSFYPEVVGQPEEHRSRQGRYRRKMRRNSHPSSPLKQPLRMNTEIMKLKRGALRWKRR
ncbi:hypothetical protein JVT61DRAFT_13297 [Boletus reticuloceps]|uniref:Uncharacterized protein n=1 Tax=Boletus reticuloceps TaxID=495285 RepID=A0A8I3ABC6_9AGAM|nr:hypothetical protein JVT61DRAFT_13297 [Boletus reticuloceps]